MPKVLTPEQVQHFEDKGWVKLEKAFPREEALKVRDFLWERLAERGVYRDRPESWTQPVVRLGDFTDPIFDGCNSDRLTGAIEDLLGEGRWIYGKERHNVPWGGFIINFGPKVPGNWHYDGSHFRHYLDSWEQGLLLVCLFSDVLPGGSGTLVAERSHRIVAKVLAQYEDGIGLGEAIRECNKHPFLAELDSGGDAALEKWMNHEYEDPDGYKLRVVETTGEAGDMFLCHPFLYHAPSDNKLGIPRFMCNRVAPTRERMNFNRPDPASYSVVERMIRTALGLKDGEPCRWVRKAQHLAKDP
jgi:hypothetical protein